MDQQNPHSRGRSPSAASSGAQTRQQIDIKHSPPIRFPNSTEYSASTSAGLGLGIGVGAVSHTFPEFQANFSAYNANADSYINNQQPQPFAQAGLADPSGAFDPHREFNQQLADEDSSFVGDQTQGDYQQSAFPNFSDPDFTIFPPTTGDQFSNTPLFANDNQLDISDNMMARTTHTPTPPHLLSPEHFGGTNQSPSFNQQQFSSSPGRHSRNVSLGPEAALLPGQLDWSHPQFQGHRRTPSEYSDVSSVAPSPHLGGADNFDAIDLNHSPMQRPQDGSLYQDLPEMGGFSISDNSQSPNPQRGRSPSHSPAMSPRIVPQPRPDVNQPPAFMLQAPSNSFGPPASYVHAQPPEAFPDMSGQMPAPPSINIDYAPSASRIGFDPPIKSLDVDSLTPPERGRPKQRPRAVTDPFQPAGLSPNIAIDSRSGASRSLSPLDRPGSANSTSSPSRRRQSTSAVPNNLIALRLVDPEYNGPSAQGENGGGGPKRVQKHPATFQCTLCPKRFTRAYNLRSHLRTHTDERPFVCTVCGKAFARQHDRKRHEGLHSGEKKFVCKGELKAGGQWGCGRRFARADALGRHFRSEAGRICIKALLDEEMAERQRTWNDQQMQQAAAQGMVMQSSQPGMVMTPGMDPNGAYSMDAAGNYGLPAALLAQYPALAQVNWAAADLGGGGSGMEDDLSGRSSFDASDYDDADDGDYASGPGAGFGPGNMQEGYGEMGYTSDYGGR